MVKEQLKVSIRKRDGFIHRVDALETIYNQMSELTDSGQFKSEHADIISAHLNYSQEILNLFRETQDHIELKCEEQELENEYKIRDEFEIKFHSITVKLNRLLPSTQVNQSNLQDLNSTLNQSGLSTFENQVKLPVINLPKFSGVYTDWLEFKELFESLIHTNTHISNVQKFHYLRASLVGTALRPVQNINLTSENYETAWSNLCKRYDNNDLLIHEHIKAIFELQVTTANDSKGFRNMIDELNKNEKHLAKLGDHLQQRNALLIFILTNKLDKNSVKEWEELVKQNKSSTLDNFENFLQNKAEILEKLEQRNAKPNTHTSSSASNSFQKRQGFLSTQQNDSTCCICKKDHLIYHCQEFLKLSPQERFDKIKILRLCSNCLRAGHINQQCKSGYCRKCNKSHNTLLHFEQGQDHNTSKGNLTKSEISQNNETKFVNTVSNAMTSQVNQNCYVLLSTVCFNAVGKNGKYVSCRALLDNGSQSNFMTYSFFKKLGISEQQANISIMGVGNLLSNITHKCKVLIKSNNKEFSEEIECLLLEKISDDIPNFQLETSIDFPTNITLADPNYIESAGIDMLIGAELFWKSLKLGRIELGQNLPLLQNSVFGWIVTGSFKSADRYRPRCNLAIQDLRENIEKFWKMEENYNSKVLTAEEQECENLFLNTYKRKENGQFVVTIPFKLSPESLGNSKNMALNRFKHTERKLLKCASLQDQYINFMREYHNLGHMSKLQELNDNEISYYFPHHAVIKPDSLTTKCRVVFDGSAVTDNGLSLNDIQYIGTVQDDLLSILIRFRKHTYVFTADICKMYRQIEINPEQRNFQRIFWRENPNEELNTFELNTVTYGTASAPYLATRCIKQLAFDNQEIYPLASAIIAHDFYVDDLISGADTVEHAITQVKQISEILASGHFTLTKWCSNDPKILENVENTLQVTQFIEVGKTSGTKLLGLQWEFTSDLLIYKFCNTSTKIINKRSILSNIARTFDPLGLLSPLIMIFKLILQELWSLSIDWDDEIPENIKSKWLETQINLTKIGSISIPRCAFVNSYHIELHGFCDASQQAYGACIYARCLSQANDICVKLICAKGKVAPLKVISIPRLELCGAIVLTRLMQKVTSSLKINSKCFYWSDSQVVLAWIKNQSRLFHIFVANRISEIQSNTDINNWFHVNTHENPADLISRGTNLLELTDSKLWWEGPSWLSQPSETWHNSSTEIPITELPETKVKVNIVLLEQMSENLISKSSSLIKLKRIVAICLRFIYNCKQKQKDQRQSGNLTIEEINDAFILIIKISQNITFKNDINILQNQNLPKKNKLSQFNPFLDQQGILRVGGRIQNANLSYDQTHPILLHAKSHLSKLIVGYEHLRHYHAGSQQLLYNLRQKFWIIGGRTLVKKIVRNCIQCFKAKPKSVTPLMGNLPSTRVRNTYPFSHTGTDFAGPFLIRSKKGRGYKTFKCYLCVFVCMATKAIHLEVITDLITETFLLALRRFVSRRGQPTDIYSDNGKTFVKASSHLTDLGKFLMNEQNLIATNCTNRSIKWHFIPAYSPNFGGLWEAGVKSTKHHLKRVLGNSSVTLEEFVTVVTEIEGILNSRPISPMSNDPSDLNALSPGHFLIGRPITSLIERDISNIQPARLSNYQRVEQIKQHFWARWYKEYISELQLRYKWKTKVKDLQKGALVLLKDNNLPPLCWKLGRITEVHPGADNIVRVVSVKTATSVVKRAVSQVCALPIETET